MSTSLYYVNAECLYISYVLTTVMYDKISAVIGAHCLIVVLCCVIVKTNWAVSKITNKSLYILHMMLKWIFMYLKEF